MDTHPPVAAPAVRAEATIVENRREGGANHRLLLRVPGWPGAAPGQFAMLSPGALAAVVRDDPLLPRPMAVYRQGSGGPTGEGGEPTIEILYKVEGRGTALLAAARVGERVRLVGPLGIAFPMPRPGRRAVLVGGGTGIASLHDLAAAIARAPGPRATVILGARTASDLMGRDDFEALEVDLAVTTEDGSAGERGRVTGPLEREVAAGGDPDVYCCGPTPMMQRCAEIAAAAGLRCWVSLENRMACGFGVCLGCAAPRRGGDYALVCRDGPVFDASEVRWADMP